MIRVLVVEDSLTVAALLTHLIDSESDMKVVGVARDGRAAIKLAGELKPDVVTMDVMLPEMDGLAAIRAIMSTVPLPIIVISSSIDGPECKIGFEALKEGALAVLPKPENILSGDFGKTGREIVRALRRYHGMRLVTRRARTPTLSVPAATGQGIANASHCELVAIGVSTGGPPALAAVIGALPADFDVPVGIVIHMTDAFIPGFVTWFADVTKRQVSVARDGEAVRRGHVYVAQGGRHLTVSRALDRQLVWRLQDSVPVNGFKPSVTPFLASVAGTCGPTAIGCIMTGMGADGVDGLMQMRRAGAHTFVQDQATSVVFGMPGAALKARAADIAVPLENIAMHIRGMAARMR